MPRQSRSGSAGRAPARPKIAPSKPAVPQQQSRPASTLAHPPAVQPPSSAGPGMLGQIASTAAGVAIGSSIGSAIGGLFGGSQTAVESAPATESSNQTNNWAAGSCDMSAKQLTKCLDDNQGNMQICNWYLEQLKSCQQAASQY
ncbi:unnamed protein product [Blumeria hordei]|uniref:CHCH domain-containing protein n=2 Tax=Blumeria hordei TaxID=2867405 RepID=A0A383UZB4_BLUHO|nr:Mitochondrial intermembrane space cysteine motif protein [Blumeria hordei DH14]SZF05257.1 unnamed protein product [Blumeria hordei]